MTIHAGACNNYVIGRLTSPLFFIDKFSYSAVRMDLIYFLLIFAIIVLIMALRRPLYLSIAAAILATILLYQIPVGELPSLFLKGLFGQATINLVLALYSITFLQRMMEKRKRLALTSMAVNNLFNNRRINAMFIPFLIGFLPSPGAVLIAKPFVDEAAGETLDIEERTFVTSYFRHISEAFLPTYGSIILALQLTGVSVTAFVSLFLPLIVVLFVLGYFFYIRKIPTATGLPPSSNRKRDVLHLLWGIWPILLGVILIVGLQLPVFVAIAGVIVLYFIVEKFSLSEILPFFRSAFEKRMIFIMTMIMVFREVINHTGMIQQLPAYFEGMIIPPLLIFGLMMFFGSLVAGGQAMITIGIPLAFSALPGAGAPLLVLLMAIQYIAMQITPLHICLVIITEANGTTFASLVRKTMPILLIFVVLSFGYYYLMTNLL